MLPAFGILAWTALAAPLPPIAERSITELREDLDAGRSTSRLLVEQYSDRIDRYDRQGPKLNAVAELNPDALALADQLDAERRQGKLRGPLHGIPMLIKGNIDTGDRMTTTAGALVLAGVHAREDAFVVKRLRAAGALILGKTNLTEFANFVSTRMPNGYSALGGQVLNPYGLDFDPGGSSAGSGAAVAASLAAAAVGTETSGSILYPANQNSLVGIKPTLGLVSRTGILPIAHSQDTPGPMARTVADAALLLGAMSGVDPADPATAASVGRVPADYTPFLKTDGLKGKRIGIPRQVFFQHRGEQEAYRLIEQAIRILRAAGAIVIDPADVPTASQVDRLGYYVLDYEFKTDLATYLSRPGSTAPVKDLKQVIAFNRAHRRQALRYGQDVFAGSQAIVHDRRHTARYRRERERDLRLSRTLGIDAVIGRFALDALVLPMADGADIGARAGYPSIVVPAGYRKNGSPVGLTFLGLAWSEPKLIEMAYAYEQASHARRPPGLSTAKSTCRYGSGKPCPREPS